LQEERTSAAILWHKEDVYAWKLVPDDSLVSELGITAENIVVIVRPPATEAHYHNPESEVLFAAFMERACSTQDVKLILLPRNKKQGTLIMSQFPGWFENGKTVIPRQAVDGMNLIWHADLVVSGGGTMNREAAALGVPVYSIFRGTIGAVDHHLKNEGRLTLVESIQDVRTKIRLVRRARGAVSDVTSRQTLNQIVDAIVEIAENRAAGKFLK
jgi:predicted glycosyltransferase